MPRGIAPLVLALAAFGGLLAWTVSVAERHTHQLVFALDDAYIHLAIAEHLARGEGFSFDGHGISSASSSPLWVALLAACIRVGIPAALAPLLLVSLSGVLLLVVSYTALRRARAGDATITVTLLAEVLLAPLVPVAVTGLEHLLHASLAVALVAWFVRVDEAESSTDSTREGIRLPLGAALAMLGCATRFEFAFEVLVVSVGLWLGARRREACVVAAAGAAPIVGYGAFSAAHGGPLLPYSVLLKASLPSATLPSAAKLFGITAYRNLADAPHLLVVVLAMMATTLLLLLERNRMPRGLLLASAITALHLQFARTGWFYRYELYLMVLAIVALGAAASDAGRALASRLVGAHTGSAARALAFALLVVSSAPLVTRAVTAHRDAPRAMRNIHDQQRQLARLFASAFAGRSVVVNDVGWVGFAGRVQGVDLMGLASDGIARARLAGALSTHTIRRAAEERGTRIVAVYAERFDGPSALPPEWIRVGSWTIPENVVCGGPTVAFFGTDPSAARELGAALLRFGPTLPRGVRQALLPDESGSRSTR